MFSSRWYNWRKIERFLLLHVVWFGDRLGRHLVTCQKFTHPLAKYSSELQGITLLPRLVNRKDISRKKYLQTLFIWPIDYIFPELCCNDPCLSLGMQTDRRSMVWPKFQPRKLLQAWWAYCCLVVRRGPGSLCRYTFGSDSYGHALES